MEALIQLRSMLGCTTIHSFYLFYGNMDPSWFKGGMNLKMNENQFHMKKRSTNFIAIKYNYIPKLKINVKNADERH